MRDVEDDLVDRRIEDAMQGNRRLKEAEVGPDMTAVRGRARQHRLTQVIAKLVQLFGGHFLQGLGPGNLTQVHVNILS